MSGGRSFEWLLGVDMDGVPTPQEKARLGDHAIADGILGDQVEVDQANAHARFPLLREGVGTHLR